MSWANKLVSNKGFNKVMSTLKNTLGWGELKAGASNLRSGFQAMNKAGGSFTALEAGMNQYVGGSRQLGAWAAGGFVGGGAGRVGRSAARIGGVAFGAGATADFLNPWGLGWGD